MQISEIDHTADEFGPMKFGKPATNIMRGGQTPIVQGGVPKHQSEDARWSTGVVAYPLNILCFGSKWE